jgi:hypothetical protein
MNLKTAVTMKIALALALGATAACTKSEASLNGNTTNRSENKAAVNTAVPNEPAKTEPAKPAEERSETAALDLSTPTAAYKVAYAARKNKDLPTLKRAMSKDALEFMSILAGPGKTVDDALRQMTETPQAGTDESRSEKITGETATLEYPDANGKWKTMFLVKENGEWKVTMPKADTPGATNKSK